MQSRDEYFAKVEQAVAAIRAQWSRPPEVGLILGTGAGHLADAWDVELRVPYADIPNFPRSTALGHRGMLVGGRWAGRCVLGLQGRFHLYEGHTLDEAMLPLCAMSQLGIRRLLISNAAGGVNPAYRVGDLMAIESQIDLFFQTSRIWKSLDDAGNRTAFRAHRACDTALLNRAWQVGRRHSFRLHQGVYVGMLGPSYETRAEYRLCRSIGGDAVGMSTVSEIATASWLGIPSLAVSIITNVASDRSTGQKTSGHGVLSMAESATRSLQTIFADAVSAPIGDGN